MKLEGLDLLSEQECRSLLGQGRVGRVAVSLGAIPAVFPVNYVVAGDEILFFTGEGIKLRAAIANTTVAFEVDQVDVFAESGWSVLVAGPARERTEPAATDGARRSGLRPWAGGDRPHLISVTIDFVSGRRIGRSVATREPQHPHVDRLAGPHSPVRALAHLPVRIAPDSTLQAAANAMREADVSLLLVGRDQAILTTHDLTRALNAGLGPQDAVSTTVVTNMISVDQDTTVVQAAADMLRHEIRHLLLHDFRGEVVGVVALRDVVSVLVDAMDPVVWALLREALSVQVQLQLG
ncbi:MAG TPA: pyridoxamine 5'-phosphate oxidase family protein [Acidimicrobiales bacterium]|nr:pyridoxamine 5'-phosphate oxidase family protein [Acidimicrobiales bacterium]